MKINDAKIEVQIDEINKRALSAGTIAEDEAVYTSRIERLASEIISRGSGVVMATGPSASGKTTSSLRLARALRSKGKDAIVISLDDFFKNIEDYPKKEDGEPDLESVYALDLELINVTIAKLLGDGECELPQFDFANQRRGAETAHVKLPADGVAIIEGIHALNPLLTEHVSRAQVFNLYVGLRTEYYDGATLAVPTRELRITRRLVRDFYFRGYSVERTLSVWQHLMDGEIKWIKKFKPRADYYLDTSLPYEPCVFAPLMSALLDDPGCGGRYRETLEGLCENFGGFTPLGAEAVPKDSLLREFVGGLEL